MWGALGGVFGLIGSIYSSYQAKRLAGKQVKRARGLLAQEYTYQSSLQAKAFEETEKERQFEWQKLQLQYSQNPFQYETEQITPVTQEEPIKKEYFLYILAGLGLIVLLTLRRK